MALPCFQYANPFRSFRRSTFCPGASPGLGGTAVRGQESSAGPAPEEGAEVQAPLGSSRGLIAPVHESSAGPVASGLGRELGNFLSFIL